MTAQAAIDAAKARLNQTTAGTPAPVAQNVGLAAQGSNLNAAPSTDATGDKPLVREGEHAAALRVLAEQAIAQEARESDDLVIDITKREYRHAFAGANTIMPDGKKLEFPGPPGNAGYFTTDRPKIIAFLDDLAATPGSQITAVFRDQHGREIPDHRNAQLLADLQRAREDAAANTIRDTDSAITTARANLGNQIKVQS